MIYGTHLCGNYYKENERCEHMLYADKPGMTFGKKQLKQYYVYCTAGGRCRQLGSAATFTGNSPTWCPKRVKQEASKPDEAR